MNLNKVIKVSVVGMMGLSVSACFGSSGGTPVAPGPAPGPGGGPAPSNYQAEFQAVQGLAPTTTALSGTASYTGQIELLTGLNQGNADESVIGDLDMEVNFDGGARPITATAENFAGEVNGQQVTIAGTLSTANNSNGPNVVNETMINAPVVGPITTTAVVATLGGTLSESTGQISGDAVLTLTGNVVGPNGEGIFGAAAATVDTGNGPFIGGCERYLNRDSYFF